MPAIEPAQVLTIVLVEDDHDVRESMEEMLRWMGHEVHTANDGESGVALILGSPPDIALVDILLPDIDGYEVATRVRRQLGPERVRLIALTGFATESNQARSAAAGFEAYLVKPTDLDSLIRLFSSRPKS
jgi:CheY-like chemotaxis protein